MTRFLVFLLTLSALGFISPTAVACYGGVGAAYSYQFAVPFQSYQTVYAQPVFVVPAVAVPAAVPTCAPASPATFAVPQAPVMSYATSFAASSYGASYFNSGASFNTYGSGFNRSFSVVRTRDFGFRARAARVQRVNVGASVSVSAGPQVIQQREVRRRGIFGLRKDVRETTIINP